MGSVMIRTSRRQFLGLSALAPLAATAACTQTPPPESAAPPITLAPPRSQSPLRAGTMPFGPEPRFPPFEEMYATKRDGGFTIPAIPYERVPERYLRQVVRDTTREAPGTVVVDTRQHFLFLALGNGNAIRYGVGLGRAGFEWSGRAEVGARRRWPRWFPPDEMIDREPELERYRASDKDGDNVWEGGMDPGITNPLGARALYIYQDGKDTLYRLHGNPQWTSIGQSVSSGCVRLMNQDVIDLYSRVPEGTPIVVR